MIKIAKNIEKEGRNSGLGKAIHDNYGTDFKLSFAINSSDSADGFLFDSFCAFSRISIRCSAVNNKPLRDYSKAGVQSDFKPNH